MNFKRASFISVLGILALRAVTSPGAFTPETSASAKARMVEILEANLESEEIEAARSAEALDRFFRPDAAVKCNYVSSLGTKPPAKQVVLTFDDGPSILGTSHIVDILNKYHIHGTFFMTGAHSKKLPDEVELAARNEGTIVGNHSWDHPNFHTLSVTAQKAEIMSTRSELEPYQEQKYFRFPFGNSTCESKDYAHSLGYKIVGWHIDSCDWAFNATGTVSPKNAASCEVAKGNTSNYVRHVVDSVKKHNGGIILMHETQQITNDHLEEIIDQLKHEGFTFTSLDDPGFEASMR